MEKWSEIADCAGKPRGKYGADRCQTDLRPLREWKMATNESVGGGGGGREDEGRRARPEKISPEWLRMAQRTNRVAFEREMERHRQRFDTELNRFWRAHNSPT